MSARHSGVWFFSRRRRSGTWRHGHEKEQLPPEHGTGQGVLERELQYRGRAVGATTGQNESSPAFTLF